MHLSQLPSGSRARLAFEQITRVMGPGWATPYNMIVVARGRPITSPAMLASLNGLQHQIATDRTVASVVGPGAINATSRQLGTFGPSLAHSAKISEESKKDLVRLIKGLGQAGAGSARLQTGLQQAASGAGQAHSGSGELYAGSQQLHAGLAQALSGSGQLSTGLQQALKGANQLKAGAGQALAGAQTLRNNVGASQKGVPALTSQAAALKSKAATMTAAVAGIGAQAQTADNALAQANAALAAMKGNAGYGTASAALATAATALANLSSQVKAAAATASLTSSSATSLAYTASGIGPELQALSTNAGQLAGGIEKLRNGNVQLASGIRQLSGGGGQPHVGLGQLTTGAGQLQSGLAQLTSGTVQLASGLSGAVAPTGQLTSGLGQMKAAVIKSRGQIPSTKALRTLEKQSPRMFSSGYFVLAAVDGAQASNRTAATFTINLLRGGTAGQIVVVSKYASSDPRTSALGAELARLGTQFGAAHSATVAIGGPAGSLGDLTSVTKSRIWLDVVVLALAICAVLAIALRALLLPAVATAFSLLVTAAAFGVLQLLFGGGHPLGGPGYLDPMTIIGIFAVVFGISVTHSAMLLMRTRDAYLMAGNGRDAVVTGLRQTAAAATGAGLVMIAAVLPFATSDLINLRQFGVGVAVASLLEILLARPVLLPAAEAVLGRFGWWPTAVTGSDARSAPAASPPRPHITFRQPRPGHH